MQVLDVKAGRREWPRPIAAPARDRTSWRCRPIATAAIPCRIPQRYRSREEVSRVRRESDPIDNLREILLETGACDDARIKDMDREIKTIVTEAAEFAQQSPEPDPDELFTDILIEA